MSAPLALSVAKGEDVTFAGTHTVSASDPTPVDISTWTMKVTVANPDGSIQFTKTPTVVNGPLGQYSWSVAHADTNIAALTRSIDIWRIDVGFEREMGIGSFAVTPSVLFGS